MHHKSGKHDLQRDLHHMVDVVAPRVESAVNTVAEKAPPLIDKGRSVAGEVAQRGRTIAVEKGTLLAERIPDNVVDRMPDTVSDRLPRRSRGRGKKLLLLGLLAAVAAFAARRFGMLGGSKSGGHQASTPPRPASAGGTTTAGSGMTTPTSETGQQGDPSDPLTEPHVNGRMN